MNYIKQINAFEEFTLTEDITVSEQQMYRKILYLNNKCFWKEEFTINNNLLMALCQITDSKVLQSTRKSLVELGLIEYTKGKKGTSGSYKIVKLYVEEESSNNKDLEQQELNNTLNTTPNNTHSNKQNNIKPNDTKTTSSGLITYFEQNIGTANLAVRNNLTNWSKIFTAEIIKQAIDITALKGKQGDYINGILAKWQVAGVKTIADVESYQNAHKKHAGIKINKFINYNQREYDFEELEKKARERQMQLNKGGNNYEIKY